MKREVGSLDYRSAGVDIERGDREKAGLKSLLDSTRDEHTLSELGLFGGMYAVPRDVPDPVLVSSTDSVGTKVKVAILADVHDTVGRDIVNHCVNDILVQGARPLFFLDYLGMGAVEEGVVNALVRGVAEGCRENGCVLLGGETAQIDLYAKGEYDIAGFVVGIVSRGRILDGSAARAGDVLLALPSSGLHTNGYTLARKIVFDLSGLSVREPLPGVGESVGSALLRVHRSYLGVLQGELDRRSIRALAHITGGGLPGNVPRSLPEGLGAEIRTESWSIPPLFRTLQDLGSVDETEMFRVFNMGVGMVAVVGPAEADAVLGRLRATGEKAWVLGRVVEEPGVHFV